MKNGFKIERGLKIPVHGKSKGYSEVIRKLKVGESVLLPTSSQSATNIGYQIFRGPGYLTVRKMSPTECRVWRIK